MKLQYLGTAAAEGWPALFCTCDNCARARAAGGKNIRTRSQAVIDDELVIDFPPDTYMHVLQNNLDASKWSGMIITHGHTDHYYPMDFEMHVPAFAHGATHLTVYCNRRCAYLAKDVRMKLMERGKTDSVNFQIIDPFVPFTHGKYEITALKADHDKTQDAYFYLISDGEKTLLYAHDTGWFPEESWEYLAGRHLDCVSLDCTYLVKETWSKGHMSLDVCAKVAEELKKLGCVDDTTKLIVNHFSHNGILTYDEMLPEAAKYGLDVSYDGKIVEI